MRLTNRLTIIFISLITFYTFSACSSKEEKTPSTPPTNGSPTQTHDNQYSNASDYDDPINEVLIDKFVDELPMPEIPANITDPTQKADYAVLHFWDTMDWNDSTRTLDPAFIEQNFSNFAFLLTYADTPARRKSIGRLLEAAKVSSDVYELMTSTAELYLYDPNSPMLSEELYMDFAEHMVNAPYPNQSAAIRPAEQIQSMRKNRPGSTITDFDFVTRDNKKTSLHKEIAGLAKAAPQIMLVFYDPECDHCHDVLKNIPDKPGVITVYSGDSFDKWAEDAETLPKSWIVGFDDGSIQDDGLYELRAMPYIFALKPDGTVLTKDFRF